MHVGSLGPVKHPEGMFRFVSFHVRWFVGRDGLCSTIFNRLPEVGRL